MSKSFSFKTLFVSIISGIIIVVLFSYLSGSRFDEASFPILALLSGFVVTGFITGFASSGVTILEPGLGSIVVAYVSYVLIHILEIKAFSEINQISDWFIIMMNGVILTFVGAWLGEKFQNEKQEEDYTKILDLSWIIAGTIFGVIFSLVIGIIIYFIIGNEPIYYIIPFFIALYVSGFLSGLKSSGVTTKEAGISGFLIMTIIFSIIRVSMVSEIEIEYIIGGLVLGYLMSLFGGWSGEKMQARK